MLGQGAVIFRPADWPHGVRIVLLIADSRKLCGGNYTSRPAGPHPAYFNITVGPNGSRHETIRATVIVTVFYLLLGLLGLALSIIVFNTKFDISRCVKKLKNMEQKKQEKSHIEETDGNQRLKSGKCVADLCNELKDKNRSKTVYKKSRLYLGILWLISIFYSLPTIQMVFRFSQQQEISENHDICYYNELCRRSLGSLSDFNHIFSNLGYCVFGLLFMLIVWIRRQKYEKFEEEINKSQLFDVDCSSLGVPRQYSLYYAMGLALTMEGVMSACYHDCPTNVTFQFDTPFMYLIAILMFMKLYQVR